MRRAEIVTAFILGVLSIYLMWKSGAPPPQYPEIGRFANINLFGMEGPGGGFWPFWLSAVMLVCCFWIAINWFRRATPPSRSDEPFLDSYGKRLVLMVCGGLLGFLILIEIFGFYVAMFVFLIYYIKFLGRHSWPTTLSVSVGVPVASFFFFDVAMRIVLPKGITEPLFIPLYDIFL